MARLLRFVVAALALGIAPVQAVITQVTNLPVGRSLSVPSITADAHYVAFSSNGNVGGLNPTPQTNVFLYEVPTGLFTRITSQGGSDPSIGADGRWLAFTSGANYAVRNVDGSDEIFRYDRLSRRFFQVTRDDNGDGSSAHAAISSDGNHVAFESSSNLARQNADLSNEVYLLNRVRSFALSRDGNGDGESVTPAISADGRFVVFQSTSNLTGLNADLSQELMIYDVTTRRLLQWTNDRDGSGESGSAAISGDGQFVAFVSSSNLMRLNPDNTSAVFVLNRARRTFSLITETAAGPFAGESPSISDDGRWVAFVSTSNAAGGNLDHNKEVVLYDRTRKTFTQLTASSGCANSAPRISGDGTHVAFVSTCDLTGGNADGSAQLFTADNPALKLVVLAEGPVTLEVRDPKDLIIRNDVNLILGATYEQGDFDGDGQPEDRVTIPKTIDGPYIMTLFPDLGAALTDPINLTVTLNGISVELANDTLGALGGTPFTFNVQNLLRPLGTIRPKTGAASRVILASGLGQLSGSSGAVGVRVTDGTNAVLFDLGRLENYAQAANRKTFKDTQNGFATVMRLTDWPSGATTFSFVAYGGDLSMFAGLENANVTLVIHIGPDAYFYQRRFSRRPNGDLVLQ